MKEATDDPKLNANMASINGVVNQRQKSTMWEFKFIAMILFTGCLFVLKVVVGHMSNSIALVADSFHMISDFAVLTVGYVALKLSKRGAAQLEGSKKFTFGWIRAEVLGGLINNVFLLALSFSVFVESLKKMLMAEPLSESMPVLIVGCVSIFVNLVGLLLFGHGRRFCGIILCWDSFSPKKNFQKQQADPLLEDRNRTDSKGSVGKTSVAGRLHRI